MVDGAGRLTEPKPPVAARAKGEEPPFVGDDQTVVLSPRHTHHHLHRHRLYPFGYHHFLGIESKAWWGGEEG